MIVPLSPRQPLGNAVQPGLLRSAWPSVAATLLVGCVFVVVASKLAVGAQLIGRASEAWLFISSMAGLALLYVVDAVLRRLRLVDSPKTEVLLSVMPPAPPPPPPLREPIAANLPPIAPRATGGDLPDGLGGAGRKASWGLEGGYVWRPPGEEG